MPRRQCKESNLRRPYPSRAAAVDRSRRVRCVTLPSPAQPAFSFSCARRPAWRSSGRLSSVCPPRTATRPVHSFFFLLHRPCSSFLLVAVLHLSSSLMRSSARIPEDFLFFSSSLSLALFLSFVFLSLSLGRFVAVKRDRSNGFAVHLFARPPHSVTYLFVFLLLGQTSTKQACRARSLLRDLRLFFSVEEEIIISFIYLFIYLFNFYLFIISPSRRRLFGLTRSHVGILSIKAVQSHGTLVKRGLNFHNCLSKVLRIYLLQGFLIKEMVENGMFANTYTVKCKFLWWYIFVWFI